MIQPYSYELKTSIKNSKFSMKLQTRINKNQCRNSGSQDSDKFSTSLIQNSLKLRHKVVILKFCTLCPFTL